MPTQRKKKTRVTKKKKANPRTKATKTGSSGKKKKASSPQRKKNVSARKGEKNFNPDHPLLGIRIPPLEVTLDDGSKNSLRELVEGQSKAVLYFYPKDDTPGCTLEAKDFSKVLERLKKKGATIFGVSPDSVQSHQKFKIKHKLKLNLVADEQKKLAEFFKVWKEKKFMGRQYMGVERSTFVFHEGKLVRAWQPVKVPGHVSEVERSLKEE